MNDPIITLDIDWAPDFVIDAVADLLVEHGVRATWFVTHRSPAVERLRAERDLFECGIHPNFLPNTTHGESPEEVLANCLAMVPEASCLRTHGLFQSSHLLHMIMRQGQITTDLSLFLPRMSGIVPVEYWWDGRRLLRLPFFWADDAEMARPQPSWDAGAMFGLGPGLKIFVFHPLHVYLNSSDLAAYGAVKRRCANLLELRPDEVDDLVQPGEGTRSMFCGLVRELAGRAGGQRVCDASETGAP